MIELKEFLTSLYDSISEAEVESLQHGEFRLAQLLGSRTVPENLSLPVYHASNVEITMEVGLEAEQTDEGLKVYVKKASPEEASTFKFTVEPYDIVEKGRLEELDYRDVFGSSVPTVDIIRGLDSKYYQILKERGIEKLSDLAESSPEGIAKMVSGESVEISPETAKDWIEQARGLLDVLSGPGAEMSVDLVDGIGPAFSRRLSQSGVKKISDLVELSPEEVADRASTDKVRVSPKRAEKWLEEARTLLDMTEAFEKPEEGGDEDSE